MSVLPTAESRREGARPLGHAARTWAWSQRIDTGLFWAFITAVAWLPFWNGSNELVAWGINAALFGALATAYELSLVFRGEGHPVGIKNVRLSAALFTIVVLWICVQTVAVPAWVAHPIWTLASDVLRQNLAG